MITFKHSGKLGDIIYSLPTIRAMGGGILYLPENGPEVTGMYSFMKSLLELDPYIHEVRRYPDVTKYGECPQPVDVDLDLHRTHPQRGKVNMVQRYFDVFGINELVPERWLRGGSPAPIDHTIISVTPRFRERSRVSWKHILRRIEGFVSFIGTDEDYHEFTRRYALIPRTHCNDAITVAAFVAGASAVYCNQSFVLTLAQSMNKTRYVEFKPGKTNCHFKSLNEFML